MTKILESPYTKLHWVNFIGIYRYRHSVWLRNEVVLVSTTHYLTYWMLNAGQSWQFSIGNNWYESHPSCCHIGGSLPSRLTAQYCSCSCYIILHFLPFCQGIVSRSLQQHILRLSAECYFQWEVANMLGVPQECVYKVLRPNRDIGRPHQWRRGGRRCLTTAREDRQLIRMVRDNRLISDPRLRVEMIRWFESRLSVWSFLNKLLAAGYMSRRPNGCPRLTLDHRRLRRAWGRMHRKWDLRHWRQCVFTDESRFTLFQSDGRARVPRRQGKRLTEACIQPMNSCLGNFVHVHDNATPHTAHDTTAFLAQEYMEVIDWTAESPEINPIEHVWNKMGVWIRDMDDPRLPPSTHPHFPTPTPLPHTLTPPPIPIEFEPCCVAIISIDTFFKFYI